jgi:hypothetical protein
VLLETPEILRILLTYCTGSYPVTNVYKNSRFRIQKGIVTERMNIYLENYNNWEYYINPNITEEKVHKFSFFDRLRDCNIFCFTAWRIHKPLCLCLKVNYEPSYTILVSGYPFYWLSKKTLRFQFLFSNFGAKILYVQ